jgi:hypothetical protein
MQLLELSDRVINNDKDLTGFIINDKEWCSNARTRPSNRPIKKKHASNDGALSMD